MRSNTSLLCPSNNEFFLLFEPGCAMSFIMLGLRGSFVLGIGVRDLGPFCRWGRGRFPGNPLGWRGLGSEEGPLAFPASCLGPLGNPGNTVGGIDPGVLGRRWRSGRDPGCCWRLALMFS